ncbi:hypothetical protein B0H14DRAFT_3439405 [Mycena olivaceomarginata]|nr:hypothetical protein B0H14DRAFT_3439405 [Mycena olivaceomarginata]
MSAAAWEESARIHREEAAQRKDRAELRKREKAMEEKETVSTVAANRRRNPSGGADLVVTCAEDSGRAGWKPGRNRGDRPNVQQAKADVELLKRLNGKGKGKRKAEEAPAPKTRPTKRAWT